MKTTLMLLALSLITSIHAMELKDAFLDDELEIKIKGLSYSESEYEDKDILIGVTNLKGYPVTITVEPGFILESQDGDVQNMIITEPMELVASAEFYHETGLQAMCIQATNKSPGAGNGFSPMKYAGGNLGALAQYVYRNNYQGQMGQEAMWVVSDGHSIYDITGDAARANPLRHFLAELTGEVFDTSLVDKEFDYVDRTIKEYALYLKFYLQERDDIKLQVYNQKGEFERDLMVRSGQEAGQYNMRYKVSLYGMVGEKYHVRLYVGEDMRNEFTLVIKDS